MIQCRLKSSDRHASCLTQSVCARTTALLLLYETTKSYNIIVEVDDGKQKATAKVNARIINDNKPQFTNSRLEHNYSIDENSVPSGTFLKMSATDTDYDPAVAIEPMNITVAQDERVNSTACDWKTPLKWLSFSTWMSTTTNCRRNHWGSYQLPRTLPRNPRQVYTTFWVVVPSSNGQLRRRLLPSEQHEIISSNKIAFYLIINYNLYFFFNFIFFV